MGTYRNLDNIRRNEVQLLQPAQNRPQLARRPAARLRGARSGCKRGIQGVDVDGEVDGPGGADALDDALDDAVGADLVDLSRLDNLEAAVAVVVVVAGPAERRADARVDVGVVGKQALHGGVVEVGAVVDAGYLGGGAAEDLGAPCGNKVSQLQLCCITQGGRGEAGGEAYRCRGGCQSESRTRGRMRG